MNHGHHSKYHALRMKTDRQLACLIGKKLDGGLTSARNLAYRDAEKAYEDAQLWLRLLARFDQIALQRKLEQLRGMLDEAAAGSVRVRTACG
jgi:hypothetical protein